MADSTSMSVPRPQAILFDLSEVLIAGMVGVEQEIAERLQVPVEEVVASFLATWPEDLFTGRMSEDEFLAGFLTTTDGRLTGQELKAILRRNFAREVEGSLELLRELQPDLRLALLSDHAREWVEHIRATSDFLDSFERTFFSYELGATKRQPESFQQVLAALGVEPQRCLFIDDSPRNLAVAASSGLQTVLFTTAAALRQDLAARGLLSRPPST